MKRVCLVNGLIEQLHEATFLVISLSYDQAVTEVQVTHVHPKIS